VFPIPFSFSAFFPASRNERILVAGDRTRIRLSFEYEDKYHFNEDEDEDQGEYGAPCANLLSGEWCGGAEFFVRRNKPVEGLLIFPDSCQRGTFDA